MEKKQGQVKVQLSDKTATVEIELQKKPLKAFNAVFLSEDCNIKEWLMP